MYVLKVPKKEAEKIRKRLLDKGNYDKTRGVSKDKDSIYLPTLNKNIKGVYVNKKLKTIKKEQNYKEQLQNKIPKEVFEFLPNSFDIIGNIVVLEITENTKKYEKEIAKAILDTNPSIKTVLKKAGIHSGEFRTQKLGFLAGENTKETTHVENKIRVKLDVEKVYFSPRLGTERKRIVELVKKNEEVLVMFSGCGPYPITISKNTGAKNITAIEKNPTAHKYALQNLTLNKTKNIELIKGDVRDIVPRLNRNFDRIVMPLPKDASTFLDLAFLVSKKGTVIHLYDFEHENEIDLVKTKIKEEADKANIKYKVKKIVKCGQYSPGKFRICVDFQTI